MCTMKQWGFHVTKHEKSFSLNNGSNISKHVDQQENAGNRVTIELFMLQICVNELS